MRIEQPAPDKFIELTDVPQTYAGAGSELLAVKVTEDGLEFVPGAGGEGTVTDVSVVTANGVSGSVATSTTTPAITLSLGAITPSSVASTGSVSGTNLSGTNTGDQASIVGITGTKAQFDTSVTDGNFLYVGDVTQYTDEMAQDAVGGIVDTTLVYNDTTPSLVRAALSGAVTASAGSNTTALGSFTVSQLNTALSDGDVATGGGTATGTNTGDQTGGTPAVVLGTANTAGVSTNFLRRDDTILAFDATSPSTQAFGDAAEVGVATVAARRDHKHAMMAAPTTVSGNAGTATALQNARTIGTTTGDVTSTGSSFDGTANNTNATTVTRINGTSLSGLATGILKNTTGTGVPSIAVNSDLPVMSATVGGAVPTPPNNTTTFLRGDGTFAAPTAAATITTQEEGVNLSTTVTTLNFIGAGVTASGAGATTTIDIPGGAGSGISLGLAIIASRAYLRM